MPLLCLKDEGPCKSYAQPCLIINAVKFRVDGPFRVKIISRSWSAPEHRQVHCQDAVRVWIEVRVRG